MEKIGLNQKNKDNYSSENVLLKKYGTQSFKKEKNLNNKNSFNYRYRLSASELFGNKKCLNNKNNNNLIKANNKIINIISNFIEKIQNENNEKIGKNPSLKNSLGNQPYNKDQKRKNKKQVTFSDNCIKSEDKNLFFMRKMSKKSQKSKSLNKNKINFISEQNKLFHRIRTTSRLPKEKEKEIVFNISSSLISLCKPKKSNSFSNDKKNLFYSKPRSYKSSKFKKNLENIQKMNALIVPFQMILKN